MSAAKHTPGPWWVTDSGVRDAGGYICHTNKAQRYEGQDERYERETAERAANARLIAAAPELLEALSQIRELAYSGRHEEHFNAIQDRAEAALAKAAGGAS